MLGRNPRGLLDFLAYPVPKACMHGLGTGAPRFLGGACPTSSPGAAQALGCSLTPTPWISFGRVTCMARATSVPELWTLGFLLLCGACFWVWVLLGLGFWLRPAAPGWGVGVCVCELRLWPATPGWAVRCGCVCLGSCFGSASPLLAGVLGSVCASVRAPLVPCHSRLGCGVWVCVLGLGFGLRPQLLAWVLGSVYVCVRAPLVPRQSWLGCTVWVCVLRLGFWLSPATSG